MNSETKICQNCKQDFIIEPDDFAFYEKIKVPAPVLCPACRFKRRAVFRNEMVLYNRKCELCEKPIVAMYHPQSPYTVYCKDCWLSDKWDPYKYGIAYDLNRPFFEQLNELFLSVPKAGIYASTDMGANINSEYINFAGSAIDCYLVFNSSPNIENCSYSRGIAYSRDVFDSYFGDNIERIYEGVNVTKSSGLAWAQNTSDSLDSWFVLNCVGCHHCFGCVNLRHKSYYWFNEQLTKEEWLERFNDIVGSYTKIEEAKNNFEKHALKFPRREHNNLRSVHCTGEYIFDSKNCIDSFEVSSSEDCGYCFSIKLSKDCYDLLGHGRKGELLLDSVATGTSQRVIGSWWAIESRDILYSWGIRACEDCIGCDSLNHGKFSILNKQYSKEEYEKNRAHIIEELKSKNIYGLYMPSEISPWAYNETVAQDNAPLTKKEALQQGFKWQDDLQMTTGIETLKPAQIPDNIKDASDSITKETLACVTCGRNYRLIQPELAFYKKMLLPIPRQCFFCRHSDRLNRRGPMMIFDRTCAKCGKSIKTNFSPDRPEIVYCEQCYQQEVV